MRVLLCGADGFLGARLCRSLLETGHQVLGTGSAGDIEPGTVRRARLEALSDRTGFEFAGGSIADGRLLEEQFSRFRPTAVVLLTGRRDLEWAAANVRDCFAWYVDAVAGMLELSHRHRVAQLVLESSYHVYGASSRFPQGEDDPTDRPLSGLGAAQRSAELAAYAFAQHSPVNITVARFFSLYGPGQEEGRLLPELCLAAEARRKLPLFGDGTASRDFIHVDDAARACVNILQRPVPWRVMNIAGGQSTTLGQVAEQVAWLADVRMQIERLPLRPGEMPQAFADVSRAGRELEFQAEISLEEGLRRTWEWFSSRPLPFRKFPAPRSRSE